jgi:hypothetical protein
MPLLRRYSILLLGILFFFTGCATHTVRHLASDASLITIGKSTKKDVLTYLGEPDSERTVSADTKQWVYFEEKESFMQKAPVIGKAFDPDGYGMVLITFKGDLVTDCRYSSFNAGELDWSKGYSWQDVKE